LPWYSWKNAYLGLNNNHSLTQWGVISCLVHCELWSPCKSITWPYWMLSYGSFNTQTFPNYFWIIPNIIVPLRWKFCWPSLLVNVVLLNNWHCMSILLCCPIMCLYVVSSVLWCLLVCWRAHALIYIICVCLRTLISNTCCVVFLFWLSSYCVYVASFSGLSIFDCSFNILLVFILPNFSEDSTCRYAKNV